MQSADNLSVSESGGERNAEQGRFFKLSPDCEFFLFLSCIRICNVFYAPRLPYNFFVLCGLLPYSSERQKIHTLFASLCSSVFAFDSADKSCIQSSGVCNSVLSSNRKSADAGKYSLWNCLRRNARICSAMVWMLYGGYDLR